MTFLTDKQVKYLKKKIQLLIVIITPNYITKVCSNSSLQATSLIDKLQLNHRLHKNICTDK